VTVSLVLSGLSLSSVGQLICARSLAFLA
jgi:hypothetical protein